MNIIEAAKELKCGKKIRRKVWEYMSHPYYFHISIIY